MEIITNTISDYNNSKEKINCNHFSSRKKFYNKNITLNSSNIQKKRGVSNKLINSFNHSGKGNILKNFKNISLMKNMSEYLESPSFKLSKNHVNTSKNKTSSKKKSFNSIIYQNYKNISGQKFLTKKCSNENLLISNSKNVSINAYYTNFDSTQKMQKKKSQTVIVMEKEKKHLINKENEIEILNQSKDIKFNYIINQELIKNHNRNNPSFNSLNNCEFTLKNKNLDNLNNNSINKDLDYKNNSLNNNRETINVINNLPILHTISNNSDFQKRTGINPKFSIRSPIEFLDKSFKNILDLSVNSRKKENISKMLFFYFQVTLI